MRFNNVVQIIKAFDEKLEVDRTSDDDLYLYVRTDKHKYYLGVMSLDEIKERKDLLYYLDLIKVKEIWMEKMKRSEKYKAFKDYGIPRYLMMDEKEKKREQRFWAFLALLMLVLSIAGKTDMQKTFGTISLFLVCLVGVFDRWLLIKKL